MVNKLTIDNQELLVLLEFNADEYGKITMCLDEKNQKVFVIKNSIIKSQEIIDKINKKHGLEFSKELNGIIF